MSLCNLSKNFATFFGLLFILHFIPPAITLVLVPFFSITPKAAILDLKMAAPILRFCHIFAARRHKRLIIFHYICACVRSTQLKYYVLLYLDNILKLTTYLH